MRFGGLSNPPPLLTIYARDFLTAPYVKIFLRAKWITRALQMAQVIHFHAEQSLRMGLSEKRVHTQFYVHEAFEGAKKVQRPKKAS